MSNETVMQYLKSGDTIYWTDPSTYTKMGPDTVLSFWETGIDINGNPGAGVDIAPAARNNFVAKVPLPLIVQRTSAFDGSTLHFKNGEPA